MELRCDSYLNWNLQCLQHQYERMENFYGFGKIWKDAFFKHFIYVCKYKIGRKFKNIRKKNKNWNSHFNIEFSVIRYFPTIHLWIDRIKYKENKKNYSSHFFEGNLDTWYIQIECNICNRSIRLFYSYQFIHSQSDCMSVDLLVIIMAFIWFIFHLFVFIVSERKKMLKFLQ